MKKAGLHFLLRNQLNSNSFFLFFLFFLIELFSKAQVVRNSRKLSAKFSAAPIQLGGPGSSDPPKGPVFCQLPSHPQTPRRPQDRGLRDRKGRQGGDPGTRLTHHRAVNVASGTSGAHLEDPGTQQVGVGAVGRCVGAHRAHSQEHQQQGGAPQVEPGTHG